MEKSIRYIGTVHSRLKNLKDCPLQEDEGAPEAEIVMEAECLEGIKDIKAGDRLLLFTWLHLADRTVLSCMPRNFKDVPLQGVFSTRSPDRPNPIGLHQVKVLDVSDATIRVAGLEVLDGTPVIDIKPLL